MRRLRPPPRVQLAAPALGAGSVGGVQARAVSSPTRSSPSTRCLLYRADAAHGALCACPPRAASSPRPRLPNSAVALDAATLQCRARQPMAFGWSALPPQVLGLPPNVLQPMYARSPAMAWSIIDGGRARSRRLAHRIPSEARTYLVGSLPCTSRSTPASQCVFPWYNASRLL